ncbi:MAG TPA: ABC transporter permease [Candidatus Polarisedimenticolaceae bacterium]|nr:ABC transporter permease [Candidatus Polarisedimenticolaceae bacterium]
MRLHRLLLYLYPASFRHEYGEQLDLVFEQRRRGAGLRAWRETLWDLPKSALQVHGDLLRQDLRTTSRSLRRSPLFTVMVILIVALGIGATTAAFSVAYHVLLRPLPFAEPDRLVRLWQHPPGYQSELSPPNFRDWTERSRSFTGTAAYFGTSVNLVGRGEPQRLEAVSVTSELFPLLGVRPLLGRTFSAEEERQGVPGLLVLGYGLWQSAFGGDPAVVGTKVLLDGAPHEIIGVMPQGFYFPTRRTPLWTPLLLTGDDAADRSNCYLTVVARLRPAVTLEQARAEMSRIATQLEHEYPDDNRNVGTMVNRIQEEISGQSRLLLLALLGAALCLLLIACTNLANLLLARALTRRKELAVRAALGAGRERLTRQLLTESLVLATLGGAAGVWVAAAAVPLLSRLVPPDLPIAASPAVDLRVLLFAGVLSTLTGVLFGVAPALKACRAAAADGLRESTRAGGGRKQRLRSMLVVAEVAASVTLLVSAGLLLRAMWRLQAVDPGFRSDHVLTLRTALPLPKYAATATRHDFYTRVLSAVRELPGVRHTAYITGLPMVMSGGLRSVSVGGREADPQGGDLASLRYVTPGFFATLGIPLLRGRDVSDADTQQSLPVAVVSESLARQYWPGQDPLGRSFRFGNAERRIVGVVRDIRVRGLQTSSEPQVYLPSQQVPDGSVIGYAPKDLVIQAAVSPEALLRAVRAIVRRADPEQPISDVRPLADVVAAETASRQAQLRVLGAFAAIAFLLAGIGIHGVLSYAVSQRAREIGVRIALGAQRADIVALVLRAGFTLATIGIVLGVGLAYAAGWGLRALLFGIGPADPPTYAAATALTLLMTLAGCLLPALKALRVDPIEVIRE